MVKPAEEFPGSVSFSFLFSPSHDFFILTLSSLPLRWLKAAITWLVGRDFLEAMQKKRER
jgi:hypothetical protein